MNRKSAQADIPSPPSERAALVFSIALVPAVSLALMLLAISLTSMGLGGAHQEDWVMLALSLAILLPLPLILRGRRTAMVFPLAALLSCFGLLVFLNVLGLGEAANMIGFVTGGGYCVATAHAFRRSRTWWEANPPDFRMVAAFLVIALGGIRLGQALAIIPGFAAYAGLDIVFLLLMVIAALPGAVRPMIRPFVSLVGLVGILACLVKLLTRKEVLGPDHADLAAVLPSDPLYATPLCVVLGCLLGGVLWFSRKRG